MAADNCASLLQVDVTKISTDLASLYVALSQVDQTNYDQAKSSWGAAVPDYFSGSFDDFKQKYNTLHTMFSQTDATSLSQDYYTRTLSPAGAQAYATCVCQTSNSPLIAWVSGSTSSSISIKVRCGASGIVHVDAIIGGAAPLAGPPTVQINGQAMYEFTAGSESVFLFPHKDTDDFALIINGVVKETQAPANAEVLLQRKRIFTTQTLSGIKTGTIRIGAGGFKNYMGNQLCDPCQIVADEGYALVPATIQQVSRTVIGGPGVRNWAYDTTPNKDTNGRIVSITISPKNVVGNDDNAQGIENVVYSVEQIKTVAVEVQPGASAAPAIVAIPVKHMIGHAA
jgi:hypothetical protein